MMQQWRTAGRSARWRCGRWLGVAAAFGLLAAGAPTIAWVTP